MDEMDRETLTKFHKPDERLAAVQDKERAAGSERERRQIRREYYREVRREQDAAGEGRRYNDRADMVTGAKDNPIGMLGPSADEVRAMQDRSALLVPEAMGRPVRAKGGKVFAVGWEPKR